MIVTLYNRATKENVHLADVHEIWYSRRDKCWYISYENNLNIPYGTDYVIKEVHE